MFSNETYFLVRRKYSLWEHSDSFKSSRSSSAVHQYVSHNENISSFRESFRSVSLRMVSLGLSTVSESRLRSFKSLADNEVPEVTAEATSGDTINFQSQAKQVFVSADGSSEKSVRMEKSRMAHFKMICNCKWTRREKNGTKQYVNYAKTVPNI